VSDTVLQKNEKPSRPVDLNARAMELSCTSS